MNKFLNIITQKSTLRAAIIVFGFSNIIVIGINLLVSLLFAPLGEQIRPISSILISQWVKGLTYSLLFTILLILTGTIFVHLGFSGRKRKAKYLILLKSTFLLSIIGIPFLFFHVPHAQVQERIYASFMIDYSVTSVLAALLFWLQIFYDMYFLKFSDLTNLLFFGIVFFIYIKIIAFVYKASVKEAFVRLLIATILLAIIWLLFSLSFQSYPHHPLRLTIYHCYIKFSFF